MFLHFKFLLLSEMKIYIYISHIQFMLVNLCSEFVFHHFSMYYDDALILKRKMLRK